MDIKIKSSNKNEVSISKEMLKEIIALLDHVDCTCVWSSSDNQYICVNEVPQSLVEDLTIKLKLAV